MDSEDYLNPDFIPDGLPDFRALPAETRFTASDGITVMQTGDRVHFALSDEIRQAIEAIQEPETVEDPLEFMGFRSTFKEGVLTVKPGPLSYLTYDTGWTPAEEFTEELTMSGISLPAYVYLRVPIKVVTDFTTTPSTTVPNGTYSSGSTIVVDGVTYLLEVTYSTHFSTRDETTDPLLEVFSVPITAGDADEDFRMLLAYINDAGELQQIHMGAITIPQGFHGYINEVSVV